MISSKAELREIIDQLKTVKILVIGDYMLDRYLWGSVERISPEAPVPVVQVQNEEIRLGGAGNVVRNLRNLGVSVDVCGIIGDDEQGKGISRLLKENQVDSQGLFVDSARPTVAKTRILAGRHHQQILRIDREKISPLTDKLINDLNIYLQKKIDFIDAIIISDYGKGVVNENLLALIGSTKKIALVDPHPRNYQIYRNLKIVKPNRREAELASGVSIENPESALKAAQILKTRWGCQMVIITLGKDGMLIYSDTLQIFRDTHALSVFDVSGAGDTVTAVFTAALAVGASPKLAGDLANIAAGIVVGEIGTAAIEKDRLMESVERFGS